MLHGVAHRGEVIVADDVSPAPLDGGDPVAGIGEQFTAAAGRENQLGAPVVRVGAAFQVAEPLQVADQLRGGGEAELGAFGQLGQAYAVEPDAAEDVQVGLPYVGVTPLRRGRGQLAAELVQQADQELADRQPVARKVS